MFLSLQIFAFKGQNIKLTVKLSGIRKPLLLYTWLFKRTPTYINEIAGYSIIAPKLENQNTRLKPEMTGCTTVSHLGGFFDFRDIR